MFKQLFPTKICDILLNLESTANVLTLGRETTTTTLLRSFMLLVWMVDIEIFWFIHYCSVFSRITVSPADSRPYQTLIQLIASQYQVIV